MKELTVSKCMSLTMGNGFVKTSEDRGVCKGQGQAMESHRDLCMAHKLK